MSLFFVNSQQDNDLDGEGASAPASTAAVTQNVSEAHQALLSFWPRVTEEIKKISQVRLDVKTQALPLARIKKIMKLDEDVKMISAEAPMLFSKAAELFIHELTLRAWIHTEDNKRRTLQRNDIAMAITKYDQFDFLIDIVPRDEIKTSSSRTTNEARTPINPDQVHYYFQLAQQHQAALQQASAAPSAPASTAPAPAPTIQVVQPSSGLHTITVSSPNDQVQQNGANNSSNSASQPQMVQLQTSQGQTGIQLVQQMVTANGEIQNVPFSPVHFLLPKPPPLSHPTFFVIVTDKLKTKKAIFPQGHADSALSQSAADDQNADKRRNITTNHPTDSSSDNSG